jgi:G:T/U-mismatch repair DNA glycosylase
MQKYTFEKHPLAPFLPDNALLLMLGSFPPLVERWSMNFFYPNFNNDMWRVMGIVFYNNPDFFTINEEKKFNYGSVVEFAAERGIAMYDTASEIRRLNGDSSDKFLEIVKRTDIEELLRSLPLCRAIVTTGSKATEIVAQNAQSQIPAIGRSVEITLGNRTLQLYRMPSTSRAYPLKIEKKAAYYSKMFHEINLI